MFWFALLHSIFGVVVCLFVQYSECSGLSFCTVYSMLWFGCCGWPFVQYLGCSGLLFAQYFECCGLPFCTLFRKFWFAILYKMYDVLVCLGLRGLEVRQF